MRVKAGGGGTKDDLDDDGQAEGSGSKGKRKAGGGAGAGGGAEAVGRVNNLVGTDVDVITSSLVSRTLPFRNVAANRLVSD